MLVAVLFRSLRFIQPHNLLFLLALRTLDKEELLVNELDGYVAYTKKVKYRLLPFMW